MKYQMTFSPMKGFGGGFRQEWVSTETPEFSAGLDSGAGLGNPLLTFWIEKKGGKRKTYTASIADLFKFLVEKSIEEGSK